MKWDGHGDAADLEELGVRLRRGVSLNAMTRTAVVCEHQKVLVRVITINGRDCALFVPGNEVPIVSGDWGLGDGDVQFPAERLIPLGGLPITARNSCCTEVVSQEFLCRLLDAGTRRAAVLR